MSFLLGVATFIGSVVAASVTLNALTARALIRARLAQDHAAYAALPDGKSRTLMLQIIDREVARLEQIERPEARLRGWLLVGCVLMVTIGLAGVLSTDKGGWQGINRPAGWIDVAFGVVFALREFVRWSRVRRPPVVTRTETDA
ncbi:hypothetical protein GCM10028814_20440 [Angustibacter aerolatus]